VAWEHRGNIKFRAFLQEVDTITALENINQIQQQQQLRALTSLNRSMVPNRDAFAEYLVGVALERGFTFLYYEEIHHWYREITETEELRRYFLSALRGHRKRTKARKNMQCDNNNNNDKKKKINNTNATYSSNTTATTNNSNGHCGFDAATVSTTMDSNTSHRDDANSTNTTMNYSVTDNINHINSNSDSNGTNIVNDDTIMDVDPYMMELEPTPIVFTNMDGKRRNKTSPTQCRCIANCSPHNCFGFGLI